MRPTFSNIAHTFASRLLVLLIMIIFFIPVLLVILLPASFRTSRVYYYFAAFFYWSLRYALLVPVHITGKENLPQDPAIIIANHQSSIDIPIIGTLIGTHPHFWLATSELLRSPIWKFVLPRVTVIVDLTTPMRAMKSLVTAIDRSEKTHGHVILFPEGSRFSDGEIHPFFQGFVILARKTGRPVVPIRIFGANTLYPKGCFFARWQPLSLVIGSPLKIEAHETEDEFKERVHRWFIQTEPTRS